MPLAVARLMPSFSLKAVLLPLVQLVVRVSRDHSVVGAQRPGVRVGAVVEL